jgi:hypothetical protein
LITILLSYGYATLTSFDCRSISLHQRPHLFSSLKVLIGILAVFIGLTGCASTEYFTPAAPRVLASLEVGHTTRDELLLVTGDPDTIVKLDDGTEILTWLDSVIYSRGWSAIPLWLIGGSKRISSETHYVEVRFRDGVMTGHRFLSTLPLDEDEYPLAASGDIVPDTDPAVAPQFSRTEGESP